MTKNLKIKNSKNTKGKKKKSMFIPVVQKQTVTMSFEQALATFGSFRNNKRTTGFFCANETFHVMRVPNVKVPAYEVPKKTLLVTLEPEINETTAIRISNPSDRGGYTRVYIYGLVAKDVQWLQSLLDAKFTRVEDAWLIPLKVSAILRNMLTDITIRQTIIDNFLPSDNFGDMASSVKELKKTVGDFLK